MSDDHLPRFKPTCPVCERPFLSKVNEERIACLRRRADFLRERIVEAERRGERGVHFMRQERIALLWVLGEVERTPIGTVCPGDAHDLGPLR